jgi:hypothetical protein
MAPRRCILVIAELKEDFRRLIEHQRLIDRGVCEPEAHEPLAFEMRRRVVALMEAMFSSRSVPPGLLHPEVALRSPGTSREGEAEVSAYLAQTSKARAAAPPQSLRVVIRADHLLVTQHTVADYIHSWIHYILQFFCSIFTLILISSFYTTPGLRHRRFRNRVRAFPVFLQSVHSGPLRPILLYCPPAGRLRPI